MDIKTQGDFLSASVRTKPKARGAIRDNSKSNAVNLPQPFQPSLPLLNTSAGVIKSYVLPDKKTGVVSPINIVITARNN